MMKQYAKRPAGPGDLAVSRDRGMRNKTVLNEYWSIKDAGSYSVRLKNTEQAYAHGGFTVGDGKVNTRSIAVEFLKTGATEEEHDAAVNDAYVLFYAQNYYLSTGRPDRCYHVAGVDKIKHEFQKGFKQRKSRITVNLLLADPFRYATQETAVTFEFKASQTGAEMVLNNPSSVDVPLIFTFTPQGKNTAADIQVVHDETGERFKMADTLLTAPAVAVVDGERGTVRRDRGNSLNTFQGVFLRALPGRNVYIYRGDAVRVDIAYTGRWFV